MTQRLPYVFIGSSAEGLNVAKAIQANLQYVCESHIWSQGLFGLSGGTLETLVNKLDSFDFAILCLTPDDLTTSRGKEQQSPRDNVVLELGLFIGKLGRERVFIVVNREAETKLPSDLAGIMPAFYAKPKAGNWQSALGPATTAVEDAIKQQGSRKSQWYDVCVTPRINSGESGTGISLLVTNHDLRELPPYILRLYNPLVGRLGIFPAAKSGPLRHTQERSHECQLFDSKGRQGFLLAMVYKSDKGDELSDDIFDKWVFQVVLEDSDTVLYENSNYGKALAFAIRQAGRAGGIQGIGNEIWPAFEDAIKRRYPPEKMQKIIDSITGIKGNR